MIYERGKYMNNNYQQPIYNQQPMMNQQPIYNQQQMINQKPKKNNLGCIIAAIVIFFILIIVGVFIFFIVYVSSNSKKLVCKSNEGNITILYNDETITGYTANGMTYDLDTQKQYAEQVGIDVYLDEFSNWFSTNTTGTCTK